MIKVVFICHGNICRSTMAEFVFKDLLRKNNLDKQFIVESAGTSSEELGNGVHRGTRKKLDSVGIPWDKNKRAVKFRKEDYSKYDYIICMDSNNVRNLAYIIGSDTDNKVSRLLEFNGEYSDIADPWYTGNFDETYKDVMRGCTALLNHFKI